MHPPTRVVALGEAAEEGVADLEHGQLVLVGEGEEVEERRLPLLHHGPERLAQGGGADMKWCKMGGMRGPERLAQGGANMKLCEMDGMPCRLPSSRHHHHDIRPSIDRPWIHSQPDPPHPTDPTPRTTPHLHLRDAQHLKHVLQQREGRALPRAVKRRVLLLLLLLLLLLPPPTRRWRWRGHQPQGQVQQRAHAELPFVLPSSPVGESV